jgi:predicted P-loop ATPase
LPLGVDAKQIIERTKGKLIIEASELHGYTNAEVDRLKSMLARQVDGPVRLAYLNVKDDYLQELIERKPLTLVRG